MGMESMARKRPIQPSATMDEARMAIRQRSMQIPIPMDVVWLHDVTILLHVSIPLHDVHDAILLPATILAT
jgi:hypothetical protein